MINLTKVSSFEVKENSSKEAIIVLYDEFGREVSGDICYWEGDFDCSWLNLDSLEGSPKKVTGSFICRENNLISLKGAPRHVGKDFDCRNNHLLNSFEGLPEEIGGKLVYDINKDQLKDSISEALSNHNKKNSYGKYI